MNRSLCLILSTIFQLNLISTLIADDVSFRLVESRNDFIVGGAFHLDLEMKITSGVTPRTLNSITVDVYYTNELSPWSSTPSTNWAFGAANGYTRSADKFDGYYRVLVTGGGVNEDDESSPPGSPPGWDVSDSWQRVVTLRWTIATDTSVQVYINEATDDAAYFNNYTNAPQGNVTDWFVFSEGPYKFLLQEDPSFLPAAEIPAEYALFQNYPNPYNPLTTIKFVLPETGPTKIKIFNANGQLIETIVNGIISKGIHEVIFDGGNLSSGTYYYRIETDNFSKVKKMVLIK